MPNLLRRLIPSSRRSCSSDRHRGASADDESIGLQCADCLQVFSEARCPDSHLRTNCCHCQCLERAARYQSQRVCVRMLCQELLDLLFQPVLERVGHDRKVQRRWRVRGQIKEPRLDTLERIFETEIQNLALCCCKIPERLPLRNAQAKPQGQPRFADFGAPARMCKPSGISSSTRKCVGSYVLFCRSSAVMVSSLVIFFTSFRFYLL